MRAVHHVGKDVMFNLDRFRDAQDAPHAGFAAALRELQAGRKTGHWIWYVFPQLAGLGRSSTAVRMHLANARPVRLEELMGSRIDALKLVSCMTLFRQVAKTLGAVDPRPQFAAMAEHADIILAAAAAQGYGRCTYTEEHLRR